MYLCLLSWGYNLHRQMMCYSSNALLRPNMRPRRCLWLGLWAAGLLEQTERPAECLGGFCVLPGPVPGAWRSQTSLPGSGHSTWLSSREEVAGLALGTAVKRPQPAHRVLLRLGCKRSFAPGGGPFAERLHPLPPPPSQAYVSGLASRPHWIPLCGSAGPASCFPFCLPARGKPTAWHVSVSLHWAPCPGSPGAQTWLLRW